MVIPKALRDLLGLTGGQEVDVLARDDRLEIVPAPTRVKLIRRGRDIVAAPEGDLPPLTDEIVRSTIEQTRR